AAVGESLDAHDAAEDLVRIRIQVGVALEPEGLRELLPGGHDECLSTEWRLALLLQLVGGEQDLFRDGAFGNSVHAVFPMRLNQDVQTPQSGIVAPGTIGSQTKCGRTDRETADFAVFSITTGSNRPLPRSCHLQLHFS